jgi:prepilin peptidase CpaA
MTGEYFRLALVAILGLLLIVAAVRDLRARIIDPWLTGGIALMAPLWWLANDVSWLGMGVQLVCGLVVFTIFAVLFALGGMGGGDVKLLGALALWFPWEATVTLIVIMSLAGGLLTVATAVHHRMTRRLGKAEVPYGIAISLAALWLLGERYFNQFA